MNNSKTLGVGCGAALACAIIAFVTVGYLLPAAIGNRYGAQARMYEARAELERAEGERAILDAAANAVRRDTQAAHNQLASVAYIAVGALCSGVPALVALYAIRNNTQVAQCARNEEDTKDEF